MSQWGQDFRPDYLRIGPAAEAMGHPLQEARRVATLTELAAHVDLTRARISAAVVSLADAGGVSASARGRVEVVGELEAAVACAVGAVEHRRAVEKGRTETMKACAEHRGCRRAPGGVLR